MIGIDTNVLLRYVMQDDPRQAAAATRLIERLAHAAGCSTTRTFDPMAARAAGTTLVD